MWLLYLIIVIGLTIYWYIRNEQNAVEEFKQRNLKYVSFGNMFTIFLKKERIELVKDAAVRREGPAFGFKMLGLNTIMLTDADIIQTILHKDFTNFTNRREFPEFNKLITENVAFVPDEQWKRLRSISSPSFSIGKLKQMKSCIDKTIEMFTENFSKQIKQKDVQNLKFNFDCFTLDIITQVAFGINVNSLNNPKHPIIVNVQKVLQHNDSWINLVKFTLLLCVPKLSKLLNITVLTDVTDFFSKLSMDIMEKKRIEYQKTKTFAKANSFIEFMLEAEEAAKKMEQENANDEGEGSRKPTKFLTNDETISQCIMFFMTGIDTTSSTLCSTAYHLALNPEKQEKLFEETMATFEQLQIESSDETDCFKMITYDNITRFEYALAVLDETLRLSPPVIFVERQASKDMELFNNDRSIRINAKKGDMFHIPVYSIHYDEKYFPEAKSFRPERFLGDEVSGLSKNMYLPFGSGPRNCIARNLALLTTRLALIHFIRLFKFEVCERTTIPMEFFNQFDVNTPKECYLRIVSRN
ncbi:hypothetical protein RDWZM_001805 [Blomia tropicalis]|uniref:Cytochrome P450 n=1 Tax=Blomia tropicalis TaxID=40697 RepID=A0A9Q0MCB4_BLOTA|nr:hypothetical protein RDWZM_001805 [Blomia tropicalis]